MEQVRIIFSPNHDIKEKVDKIFKASYDKNTDVVFGIHIRRGDYKNWCQGRFYYSDDTYIRIMRHLQTLFPNRVRFFCSTNEPLSPAIIKEFSPLLIPSSTAADDLYGLSLCDYIIGPPSTFSQWAPFYGKVPLYLLETPNALPNIDDFSCIYALDHFKNGYVLNIHELE